MGKNAQRRRRTKEHKEDSRVTPKQPLARSHRLGPPFIPPFVAVTVPASSGQDSNKHWFARNTHNLLSDKTLRDLGLVWAALYLSRFNPETKEVPPFLPCETKYRYIADTTLDALELHGIPARGNAPFKFSYPDVLIPHLPERVNREQLFRTLSDVMYCYWSVQKGIALLLAAGLVDDAKRSRFTMGAFAKFLSETEGISEEQVIQETDQGLNSRMMEAKWLADATIVKMRALWDKLLTWLSRDYYCVRLNGEKWGDRTRGRVGHMVKQVLSKQENDDEISALDAFISLCCDLEELKTFRDNDLHSVSPRIAEAIGRAGKDMDMLAVWQLLLRELNKCNEALMLCFTIMLSDNDNGASKIANLNTSP